MTQPPHPPLRGTFSLEGRREIGVGRPFCRVGKNRVQRVQRVQSFVGVGRVENGRQGGGADLQGLDLGLDRLHVRLLRCPGGAAGERADLGGDRHGGIQRVRFRFALGRGHGRPSLGGGQGPEAVVDPQPGGGLGGAAGGDGPAQAEAGAFGQIGPVLLFGVETGVRRRIIGPAVGVGGKQVAVSLVGAPPAALLRLEPQGAERHLIAVAQVARGGAGQIVLADGLPGRVGPRAPGSHRMVGGQKMFGPGRQVVRHFPLRRSGTRESRTAPSCGGPGTLDFVEVA